MLRHRTPFEKKALLRDGHTPSTYGFACGLVQRCEINPDNRVTLSFEHGCYHLKGFDGGKHFHIAHRFIQQARPAFREIVSRLTVAKLQGKISCTPR